VKCKQVLVQVLSPNPYVGPSICVGCIVKKTADWIKIPFGVVGRLGPRHRVGVGVKGQFWGGYGAYHCNQRVLCGAVVRKCEATELPFRMVTGGQALVY